MGDFNKCSMKQCLGNFYQYVSCPTRFNMTLDLCYGIINGAYKYDVQPPVGAADHNIVLFVPVYKTALKKERPQTKSIRVWPEESTAFLQGYLECTDWDVFMILAWK